MLITVVPRMKKAAFTARAIMEATAIATCRTHAQAHHSIATEQVTAKK
jgi:hypothetical protein